jgi:hypothetical protein
MADTILTPTIIAKEALTQLDNNLQMGNLVYRDYEAEFGPTKIGATVTIRRPVQFTVASGATLQIQDVQEGSLTLSVDTQKHVGFDFLTVDLTLSISDFSTRYIKPAMIQLANAIDADLLGLYVYINNWVGAPGQTINSITDWNVGVQRLAEGSVPMDGQISGVLTPNDWYALAGSFSSLYIEKIASEALKGAKLPKLSGVDVYMDQNVKTHTVGVHTGTPLLTVTQAGAADVTYGAVLTSMTSSLTIDGFGGTDNTAVAGDVFTLSNVYAVNRITKATLDYLQPFVVISAAAIATGTITMTVYPAVITSGPYQTVSQSPVNNTTVTWVGTSATSYRQNMVFHRDAFALVTVPIVAPPSNSGVAFSSQTYKGLTVSYASQFDITNYRQIYRLDVLYGVKAIDPRMAVRLSGSS